MQRYDSHAAQQLPQSSSYEGTLLKSRIFRERALQQYIQSREKSILPRFVSPPIFLFLWLLLALLIIAGIVAWLGQIPVYVTGTGIIRHEDHSARAMALVFVPASEQGKLHPGQTISLGVGSSGHTFDGVVSAIDTHPLSPDAVKARYGLSNTPTLTLTEPVIVLTIRLKPPLSEQTYLGSSVQARVQTGSRSVLSLFPIFDRLLAGAE